MLVLSRGRNQKIVIGSNIVIEVMDIRPNQVRLGITAPVETSVHRLEIAQKIERERRERDGMG